jgi:hypothetical protein
MRSRIVGLVGIGLIVGISCALAADRLAPGDIQSTFFNGQAFTAATPSNVKFKMTFSPDGKVTREPVGSAGAKGQGTWKLSKDGFCTTWQGGQPNCFSVLPAKENKWSVLKGTSIVATWSK